MAPEERAAKGIFLALQYPVEIPGVTTLNFLKTALNAQRRARGENEVDAMTVLKLVRAKAKALNVSEEMLKRALNVGFSGGEKKRLEILQMALFEPALAILDETDSGLDIDALKLVAEGVNALRAPERAMLVITHYQRLLNLHRARSRACAGGRADRRRRRQGAGARARSQGLCGHREGRGMSAVATDTLIGPRRGREAAAPRPGWTRAGATPRWRSSARKACRIAGSRTGNIPICARRFRRNRLWRRVAAANPFAGIAGTRLDMRDGKLATALANMPKTVEAFDLADLAAAPDWVKAHLGRDGQGRHGGGLAGADGGRRGAACASGCHGRRAGASEFRSDAAHHARVLIVLEDGAALTLLESHGQCGQRLPISVSRSCWARRPSLTHIRLAQSAARPCRSRKSQ